MSGRSSSREEKVALVSLATRRSSNPWSERVISEALDLVARRSPDAVALRDDTSSLTFAELRDRRDQLAAALHGRGLADGQTVAFLFDDCWEKAVLLHAALLLG